MKRVLRSALILVVALPAFDSALCNAFEYNSHGKRDPFAPLVGPDKPTAVTRLADVASVEEMSLEGIVTNAKGEVVALVNGEMLKTNDRVGEITVKSITSSGVTLSVGGKEYKLRLPEERGQSSE
jgi:hypothetical protein